jgi:hypothetical protein
METCNDNYGRTKNDNINEWNEKKKVKYKERNNWKKKPILAINMVIMKCILKWG